MAQYHDYDMDLHQDDALEYEPRAIAFNDPRFLVPLGLFLCAVVVIGLAMRADSRRDSTTTESTNASEPIDSFVDEEASLAQTIDAAQRRAGYEITVFEAANGIIVLEGTVSTAADSVAAGAVARSTLGVQHVDNRLLVTNPDPIASVVVDAGSQESATVQIQSIEGITFEPGSALITSESIEILDRAAQILGATSGVRVEVHGHTDAEGSAASNERLSQLRASAVVTELSSRGVESRRLIPIGFGESDPIAPNITEDGRAKNRRIEFIVIPQ